MYILTEFTPQCVSTMQSQYGPVGYLKKVLTVFQSHDMLFTTKKVFPVELS